MNELIPPIFVIGAARSGTHFLSNIINQNFDDINYIGEQNELWKNYSRQSNSDYIPKKYATEAVKRKVREEFFEIQNQNNKVICEKTPANTLRFPFIYEIFPKGKYVHIIRDGRDVAISARKKYLGDIRKISKNEEMNFNTRERFKNIIELIKRKIKNKNSLKVVLKQFPRYKDIILSKLGLKDKIIWGPRFPGINEYYKEVSLLELGAIQWQNSVSQTKNFLKSNNEINYIEVKYEELLENPNLYLKKIFDFLELEYTTIDYDVVSSKNNWEDKLTYDEKISISQHIEFTLKNLDYKSTFEN